MKYECTRQAAINRWQGFIILSNGCHILGIIAAIIMFTGAWIVVLPMLYFSWKQIEFKVIVDQLADALNTGTFSDD